MTLFHCADLQADLPGQVRRLADVLGVAVSDEQVERISTTAQFDRMMADPDRFGPELENRIWKRDDELFHRGA